MGIFSNRYNKPGPGIPKDAPKKKGLALFFEIFQREFFELVKLNLLFLLFCIPVATIPAACTAMSKITLRMVSDQNHFLWTEFWAEFKADFVKSLGAGAVIFLGIGSAAFGLWFYSRAMSENSFFYLPFFICCVVLLVLVLMSYYVFPMVALVDLPLKLVLKNAFLLSFVCLKHNFLALLVTFVLNFLAVGFLPLSAVLWFVLWFSLNNFITTFAAYGGICKYVVAGG